MLLLQVLKSVVGVREAVAGEKDTRRVIAEGTHLATRLSPLTRDQLTRHSQEADESANQLAELAKKGLVRTGNLAMR